MSLEQVFYLSQSVAAVAVVISIIYLAHQVRQGERVQRAMMQQGRADRTSHAAISLADPALVRVFQKGAAGDPALTREEFAQWMMICRSGFLSAEDSFLQHQAGLLAESTFESYVAGLCYYMAMPGMRAAWQVSSGQFGREFRDFVDGIIATTPATPGPDLFAEWQKKIQSLAGAQPG